MVSLNPHCTGITRYPRIKHRYYLNISAKSDKGQGNTSLANTYYNLDSVFATVPRIIQGHSKQHTTLAQISVLTEFTFESREVHKVNRQSHSCIFTHTHTCILEGLGSGNTMRKTPSGGDIGSIGWHFPCWWPFGLSAPNSKMKVLLSLAFSETVPCSICLWTDSL